MDLIILGPSSSGKTSLANFIASKYSLPIFNCDSIQIYKNLDFLSNKPKFISQEIVEEEIISYTERTLALDLGKYKNFIFSAYVDRRDFVSNQTCNINKILLLIDEIFSSSKSDMIVSDKVVNFLFDIKDPGQNYSTHTFELDLTRIVKKFNIYSKIIVGGSVYYAFNYLFGLNREINSDFTCSTCSNISEWSKDELINFLYDNDPQILEFIDIKNRRRLESAARFVLATSKKYSEEYFRKVQPKRNFFIILIYPIDREEYYKHLDNVIEKRFNSDSFNELEKLIYLYGHEIIPWLNKISYEYRYFLSIYTKAKDEKTTSYIDLSKLRPLYAEYLTELKYKEHQYAKRQITFLRRLERKLKENLEIRATNYKNLAI
ncbi:MAG: hypothetical protein KatS3mg084_0424 [Candidatus Dojkabacteria bacterium]|nr:MAG: hypothetical protein KatS3mg084_0424 [Candidatus Dojkabacteria bacterium]